MKFLLLGLALFAAPAFADEDIKTVSKADCLKEGGRANDGPGKYLLCEGGKYNGRKIVSCTYQLDGQAYVDKDDGELVYEGKKYRCESIRIGYSVKDLCRKVGSRSKNFDFMVGFDGAENDFFVFNELDGDDLCHGVAKDGKKK